MEGYIGVQFQFLIGRLFAYEKLGGEKLKNSFQFLIGRLFAH